jgi:hypothetical protein
MNGTSTADNHGGRPAKRVNLALQGGGAHGVFTWEVLDRLIEDQVLAHAADELWDCRSCRATGQRDGSSAGSTRSSPPAGRQSNPLSMRRFQTIENLRLALLEFADWYNTHWLVARHRHKTARSGHGRPAANQGLGRMTTVLETA